MIINKILAYSETHNNVEQEDDCQSQVMNLNSPQIAPIAQCKLTLYCIPIFGKTPSPLPHPSCRIRPPSLSQLQNSAPLAHPSCRLGPPSPSYLQTRPPQPILAAELAPLANPSCRTRHQCQPAAHLNRLNLTFGKLPLGNFNIW